MKETDSDHILGPPTPETPKINVHPPDGTEHDVTPRSRASSISGASSSRRRDRPHHGAAFHQLPAGPNSPWNVAEKQILREQAKRAREAEFQAREAEEVAMERAAQLAQECRHFRKEMANGGGHGQLQHWIRQASEAEDAAQELYSECQRLQARVARAAELDQIRTNLFARNQDLTTENTLLREQLVVTSEAESSVQRLQADNSNLLTAEYNLESKCADLHERVAGLLSEDSEAQRRDIQYQAERDRWWHELLTARTAEQEAEQRCARLQTRSEHAQMQLTQAQGVAQQLLSECQSLQAQVAAIADSNHTNRVQRSGHGVQAESGELVELRRQLAAAVPSRPAGLTGSEQHCLECEALQRHLLGARAAEDKAKWRANLCLQQVRHLEVRCQVLLDTETPSRDEVEVHSCTQARRMRTCAEIGVRVQDFLC
mmetsp:Transcript_36270/g.71671  ORF Transcript_36270/g.71671 Transcript_36270/m.71671 type:complete len:430 (-) Transcript_36270:42-1331(-)